MTGGASWRFVRQNWEIGQLGSRVWLVDLAAARQLGHMGFQDLDSSARMVIPATMMVSS